MTRRPPRSTRTDTLFPYTTLFRSLDGRLSHQVRHQYPYCLTLRKFWLAQESGNDEPLLQAVGISKDAPMNDTTASLPAHHIPPPAPRQHPPKFVLEIVGAVALAHLLHDLIQAVLRSEHRRVGKEGFSTCRF